MPNLLKSNIITWKVAFFFNFNFTFLFIFSYFIRLHKWTNYTLYSIIFLSVLYYIISELGNMFIGEWSVLHDINKILENFQWTNENKPKWKCLKMLQTNVFIYFASKVVPLFVKYCLLHVGCLKIKSCL